MGAILLIGLDVKNGIMLIEYIGQLRAGGLPLDEALVQAGRTRFRPILMTSLARSSACCPWPGLGPGAQMQQPLAIAVIGGLVANTALTRLLIPVGYLALQGRKAERFSSCCVRSFVAFRSAKVAKKSGATFAERKATIQPTSFSATETNLPNETAAYNPNGPNSTPLSPPSDVSKSAREISALDLLDALTRLAGVRLLRTRSLSVALPGSVS